MPGSSDHEAAPIGLRSVVGVVLLDDHVTVMMERTVDRSGDHDVAGAEMPAP